MKRAILLPYTVGQNEPSIPFSTIFEVPDTNEKIEAELRTLFFERVCDNEDIAAKGKLHTPNSGDYGDMHFCDEYGDMFIFLTFIDC